MCAASAERRWCAGVRCESVMSDGQDFEREEDVEEKRR